MTQPDKLMGFEGRYLDDLDAQELLMIAKDAVHENERLRSAIHNLEPLRDFDWHGKWRIIGCLDALQNQIKDSVPCATCGKPMEDRGAEKQWCAECSTRE